MSDRDRERIASPYSHRKSGTKPRADKGVSCNSRICVHHVDINDVIKALQKDEEDTCILVSHRVKNDFAGQSSHPFQRERQQ